MKKIITILAAFAVLAPVTANAQERLSDTGYVAASRCLAYAELPQLGSDGVDYTALRASVDAGSRPRAITARARDATRQIRGLAGGTETEVLRTRRDEACASFVQQGLVQAGSSSAS